MVLEGVISLGTTGPLAISSEWLKVSSVGRGLSDTSPHCSTNGAKRKLGASAIKRREKGDFKSVTQEGDRLS